MANKITAVFDLDSKGFDSGLKSLRKSVAEAEGGLNKAKTAASGLWDNIKANAGAAALAGGAALVAFGAKAVSAFQESAISAGKFSDATGLAVEDASRWIEVAGDVGVSAETMQGAFVKLNKALATGDLKKFGVELRHTADGAIDVNGTMLDAIRVIGGIQDPTKRAEAAQKAFGRSYAEAAEIIFDSADNVQKKLGEVSDAKVINEDELAKARKFREAMDNLHDALEDVQISVGGELAPAVATLAELLTDADKAANDLKGTLNDLPGSPGGWLGDLIEKGRAAAGDPVAALNQIGDGIDELKASFEGEGETVAKASAAAGHASAMHRELADATDTATNAVDAARQALINKAEILDVDAVLAEKDAKAQRDAAAATDRARRAAKLHAEALADQTDAILGTLDALYDYESASMDTADAVEAMNGAADESGATMESVRRAQIDAAQAALSQAQAFAQSKGAIDGSTLSAQLQLAELNRLAAKFPELSAFIQGYINQLNSIPSVKSTQLVVTSSGKVTTKQTIGAGGRLVAGAEGAIVNRPTMALIGEAGPEAVVPLNRSPGNSPLPAAGGLVINAYITANDTESVFDKLAREVRTKGPGPVRRALGID